MKINLNKLYVVYEPAKHSERADIFDGRPDRLQGLYNQFFGGLTVEMIHGIYTSQAEAEEAAQKIFRKYNIKR